MWDNMPMIYIYIYLSNYYNIFLYYTFTEHHSRYRKIPRDTREIAEDTCTKVCESQSTSSSALPNTGAYI